MRFCTEVGLLFVLLAGIGLSQQSSCWKQLYGNCDPGPYCKNWDNLEDKDLCFDCGNGGYFTWDKVGDGIADCTHGADEYLSLSDSALHQTLRRPNCIRNGDCIEDAECCSRVCMDRKCWWIFDYGDYLE